VADALAGDEDHHSRRRHWRVVLILLSRVVCG
jgi:hypothetical protein